MTKLKKPITLTIETIEDAIGLRLALNVPESTPISLVPDNHASSQASTTVKNSGALSPRRKIEEELTAQGIDWNNLTPAAWLKIVARECTFHPNGTIALPCGVTIANDEINEFLKHRKAAMGIGEWPKFYLSQDQVVWRWRHTGDYGQWWESDRWNLSINTSVDNQCKPGNWTPITPEEAAAMIGAENLLKSCRRFSAGTVPAAGVTPQQRAQGDAESLAATSDLFDALKGLYEAVRLLRTETISIDNTRNAAKNATFKAAR